MAGALRANSTLLDLRLGGAVQRGTARCAAPPVCGETSAVDVAGNDIGEDGAAAVAGALGTNRTLTLLDIESEFAATLTRLRSLRRAVAQIMRAAMRVARRLRSRWRRTDR